MKDQYKTKEQLINELIELRQRIVELGKSEKCYRNLVECARDVIYTISLDGTFASLNPALENITGWSCTELIGKPLASFVHPDDWPLAVEMFERMMRGVTPPIHEVRVRKKSGEYFIGEFTITPDIEHGKVVGVLGVGRDITERKRTEEAIKKSTQLLRDTGEMAKVGGWELDLSTKEVSWTEEVARIHGVEPGYKPKLEEAIKFYAPESIPALKATLKKTTETGEPYDLESLFIPSGSKDKIWVRSLGRAVYSGGKIVKLTGTFQNIDKYKRAEEALQASETKYRIVADNTYDWEFWTSPEGRFLYTSPSCKRITGHAPDEFMADPDLIYRIVHPDDRLDFDRHKDEMTQKSAPYEGEFRVIRPDGTVRWIGHACQPVFAPDGHFLGTRSSNRDITERKRVEEELRESEERYRSLFDGIPIGLYRTNSAGEILDANPALVEMLGYPDWESLSKVKVAGTDVDPEERKRWLTLMEQEGIVRSFQRQLRRCDGSIIWVEENARVVRSADSRGLYYYEGSFQDITEHKRAEEALQKNLTLYRGLIETTDTGFVILGQEGKVLDANQEYVHLSGHEDLSQIRGRSVVEWTADYEKERNAEAVGKCFREGQIRNLEIDYVNAQGKITPIEINATVVKVDGAQQILTLCRDITERKRVEGKLKTSEFLLKEAQHVASIGHWELNPAVGTPTWSEEIFHIFGLDPAQGEPSFKDHQKIIHPDDWNILNSAVTIASAEGVPFDIEFRLLRPDRSIRWMNAKGYSIKDSEGHIVRIFGTAQDITERKRVEETLRRKSGEQALLLDNIQTQVWYLTDEETYGAVNKARAEFFGKKNGEMENKKLYDVLSKNEAEICMSGYVEVFEKRKQIHTKEWITNAKGEKRLLSIIKSPKLDENGDVEYVVCSAEDITERKRAEDGIKKLNKELERRVIERTTQLEAINKDMQKEITERRRAEEELKRHEERLEELVKERTQKIRELERQRAEIEKLAAAGLMAARIAHEINNPLAGIKNSFLLIKDAIPQDHRYYEYVGRIDNEINRVARIVRQMFDVYRPEQEIKKEFPVDKTLYEVVALLEAAWRENNVTIEIDSRPITMEMPEGLLRQVLYNILVNAIEASPQGGVVRIMTEVDNEILTLSISDQGVGIPLEVQPRIFEPFFTGKHGSQKGLGLGLAVSKDIVEKLGGHIDFESEPGKGTLFRIILPLKSGERR